MPERNSELTRMSRREVGQAVSLIAVGLALYFSDAVFQESYLVHTLVGGLGFTIALVTFLQVMRRKRWIIPKR